MAKLLNTKKFNGPALLVGLFRELDPVFRGQLLNKLKSVSPILARLIDECEFIYNDLQRLDDKSLQLVLRTIPEKDWLIAWKLTNEPLRQRLLAALSESRRADFLQAAAAQPKLHKRQVVRVQVHIAKQIYQLLQQGKVKVHSRRPRSRA